MKFEVSIENFRLQDLDIKDKDKEEVAENIAKSLIEPITKEIERLINEKHHLKGLIENEVKGQMNYLFKKELESVVDKRIRDTYEGLDIIAKRYAEELKDHYSNEYATSIVKALKNAGFLKDMSDTLPEKIG